MTLSIDGSGGGRKRWPLDFDTHDPEGIADFCLGIGYGEDSVVTAIEERCNVDRITARRIVKDVANQLKGGQK